MKMNFLFLTLFVLISCGNKDSKTDITTIPDSDPISKPEFYFGADLSYVNEMIDCGATFYSNEGVAKDPYEIFSEAGSNLVRVRLWNNPDWTNYSNLEDVKKTISRSREEGMAVLLDFHYSDTWADPQKQYVPADWAAIVNDTDALGQALYDYTYDTLLELANENLLPEMVQVGNEINAMILQAGEPVWPIDWDRNAYLINKGIQAVRTIATDKNTEIDIMLHIAQPENGLWWFEQATENGIADYDWIGLSYYPKWSTYSLETAGQAFKALIETYNKRLMIVETAYPFSLENADEAGNILGEDALIFGYPATETGQYNFLKDLKEVIATAGGEGLVYWEPAWVSTSCSTLWGQGSHWDNATLFNHNYNPTLGMQFFNESLNE